VWKCELLLYFCIVHYTEFSPSHFSREFSIHKINALSRFRFFIFCIITTMKIIYSLLLLTTIFERGAGALYLRDRLQEANEVMDGEPKHFAQEVNRTILAAQHADERYLESVAGVPLPTPKEPEHQSGYGGGYNGGHHGGGMIWGRGYECASGGGGMMMGSPGRGEQMAVIHNLLDNRRAIVRSVTDELWGATTVTTSTDSQVTDWIRTHVEQMMTLVENNGRIRQCDPLFNALFDNHHDVSSSFLVALILCLSIPFYFLTFAQLLFAFDGC
jgi:hypothetical protein